MSRQVINTAVMDAEFFIVNIVIIVCRFCSSYMKSYSLHGMLLSS